MSSKGPNMQNLDTIGARLRFIRELKDVSQGELAEKTGVSKGAISMAERDITSPSADNLAKICRALQVSSDTIVLGRATEFKDEWSMLVATPEGFSLRQAVLTLHKSKKLAGLFSLANSLTPDQIDLLMTMGKAMVAQSEHKPLESSS